MDTILEMTVVFEKRPETLMAQYLVPTDTSMLLANSKSFDTLLEKMVSRLKVMLSLRLHQHPSQSLLNLDTSLNLSTNLLLSINPSLTTTTFSLSKLKPTLNTHHPSNITSNNLVLTTLSPITPLLDNLLAAN